MRRSRPRDCARRRSPSARLRPAPITLRETAPGADHPTRDCPRRRSRPRDCARRRSPSARLRPTPVTLRETSPDADPRPRERENARATAVLERSARWRERQTLAASEMPQARARPSRRMSTAAASETFAGKSFARASQSARARPARASRREPAPSRGRGSWANPTFAQASHDERHRDFARTRRSRSSRGRTRSSRRTWSPSPNAARLASDLRGALHFLWGCGDATADESVGDGAASLRRALGGTVTPSLAAGQKPFFFHLVHLVRIAGREDTHGRFEPGVVETAPSISAKEHATADANRRTKELIALVIDVRTDEIGLTAEPLRDQSCSLTRPDIATDAATILLARVRKAVRSRQDGKRSTHALGTLSGGLDKADVPSSA